jgi:hypothetical protein
VQEHEADHSPSTTVDVKNDGPIPPLPHMSPWRDASLIKNREDFICLFSHTLFYSRYNAFCWIPSDLSSSLERVTGWCMSVKTIWL